MKNGLLMACFILLYFITGGCQSTKVPYYGSPDMYHFVKELEMEAGILETESVPDTSDQLGEMPPDYFDFRRAAEAYEIGRNRGMFLANYPINCSLSVYSEADLVAQAFRDGFEEQMVREEEAVKTRNEIRKACQRHFWGVFSSELGQNKDTNTDGGLITTNCYVHLLSSYVRGYRNGYRVVAKLKKSPIATCSSIGGVNLSSDPLKRAYVYGWYFACYDFFKTYPDVYYANSIQYCMDPRIYYWNKISHFRRVEERFLSWIAENKNVVTEIAETLND